MRFIDLFLRLLNLSAKFTPFEMLSLSSFAPSKIIADKYIGVMLENSVFPWIPIILHKPIRSEQLKTALLLFTGKSLRPGFVRNTFYLYFSFGYIVSLRKAKGFAPEKEPSYWLMQQFPQKTSEQYSQTS